MNLFLLVLLVRLLLLLGLRDLLFDLVLTILLGLRVLLLDLVLLGLRLRVLLLDLVLKGLLKEFFPPPRLPRPRNDIFH